MANCTMPPVSGSKAEPSFVHWMNWKEGRMWQGTFANSSCIVMHCVAYTYVLPCTFIGYNLYICISICTCLGFADVCALCKKTGGRVQKEQGQRACVYVKQTSRGKPSQPWLVSQEGLSAYNMQICVHTLCS